MNMDLPLILSLATIISLVIALLDYAYFARHRLPKQKTPWLADVARGLWPVLLIVLCLRSFVGQPFLVPTGSLQPTIEPGDFVLVNMFTYGVRLPVCHQKIVSVGHPKRGDIALFRWPVDPKRNLIKRVIGLPGDRISYQDKRLAINGKPVLQHRLHRRGSTILLQETLGKKHYRIYQTATRPAQNFKNLIVPTGHYFVMGDNRDASDDSRYWGFVPESALIGQAWRIGFSVDLPQHWWSVRWRRIGTRL